MAIHYVSSSDLKHDFKDGFSMIEVLPGMHEAVRTYKCILKSGSSITLDLYKNKFQVFAFAEGVGAIVTESNAYSITEEAYFVPLFDTERVIVVAATDLVFMRYDVTHTEADVIAYEDTHMVLPYFAQHSQLMEYDQSCKGPNTRSWSIIPSGNLGRILMGVVKAEGEGTDEKGHGKVAQWNYCLKDSDFNMTVEKEGPQRHLEGDFSFVVAGDDHSLIAEPGKKLSYTWFEYYVNPEDVTADIIPQAYGKNQ